MIQRRISDISSDQDEFNKSKDIYNKALKDSGYKEEINYQATPTPRKHTRRRKIIWFNPPYNAAVESNIGKQFISIIKKTSQDATSITKYSTQTHSRSATVAHPT